MADSEKSLLRKLPGEVENIEDIDRVKKEFEEKLAKEKSGFFGGIKKWNYKRQINKFENNKENPLHAGTKGENKVIDELSKLDDSYHVLAGIEVHLSKWVTYNGKKNLRSAQMDIIVVCPKGVFMIEVKNWSDNYTQNNKKGLNPYEQTERAGRVLWIFLQDVIKGIKVTNILLSIQGNMSYNQNYRSVFVSSLNQINSFLENRQDSLNEKDVNKIIKNLQRTFTW
ncbi:MAG: NERD domain-containing protein [Nitrosopumilus sp.]|nr:NERD domain-containing protein [Nitrosopumilus sp.]